VSLAEAGGEILIEDLPTVQGDARQLAQLLANLIANAVKFRVPDRAPLVRISAEREAGSWRVVVADNGIGIAERHRERVFRLFQRLHLREAYEGTGLGLSFCRKIVMRHHGRIWIEDGIDGGRAICFTIPDRGQDESLGAQEGQTA
jgi:light-regulated signal transduction histidine kinase (bacteriophytochrome)